MGVRHQSIVTHSRFMRLCSILDRYTKEYHQSSKQEMGGKLLRLDARIRALERYIMENEQSSVENVMEIATSLTIVLSYEPRHVSPKPKRTNSKRHGVVHFGKSMNKSLKHFATNSAFALRKPCKPCSGSFEPKSCCKPLTAGHFQTPKGSPGSCNVP